jgi:hypothetical protein
MKKFSKEVFGKELWEIFKDLHEGKDLPDGFNLAILGFKEEDEGIHVYEAYFPGTLEFLMKIRKVLIRLRENDKFFPDLLGNAIMSVYFDHVLDVIKKTFLAYISRLDKKEDAEMTEDDFNLRDEFGEIASLFKEFVLFLEDGLKGVDARFMDLEQQK